MAATVLVGAVAAQTPRRVALLIGNAAYEAEKPLRNPVNDANAIAAVLRNELGFTDVKVLPNVRRRELVDAVARFGEAARGADAALFYFSGHGQQQGKSNYLLPVDARIDRPEHVKAEGLDADDVQAALEAASPRVSLLILDACRDNPFAGRTKSMAKGLIRPRNPEEGTLIAFATRDGDVAQDGTGSNSPYAQALITSLKQADRVPIQAMFDNVSDHVRRMTENRQRPTKYGDMKVTIYLVGPTITVNNGSRIAASGASRSDPDEEAWRAAQAADSVEGYEQYLTDFRSGRNVSAAKIMLAVAKRREAPRTVVANSSASPAPTSQGAVVSSRPAVGSGLKDCDICPQLVVIPKGELTMGSSSSEAGRYADEGPQQWLMISRTLAVGKYEVTQGEWQAVMGSNPSVFAECGPRCPVENISWNQAKEYVRRLNDRTGNRFDYRLLSEAEWEYAARANCEKIYATNGLCSDSITAKQANFNGNYAQSASATGPYRGRTIPVGSLDAPNAWGLHDMHGNVMEWVEDCYNESLLNAPTEGAARTEGCTESSKRVLRGGHWGTFARGVRLANRERAVTDYRDNYIGFRVVRTLPP